MHCHGNLLIVANFLRSRATLVFSIILEYIQLVILPRLVPLRPAFFPTLCALTNQCPRDGLPRFRLALDQNGTSPSGMAMP